MPILHRGLTIPAARLSARPYCAWDLSANQSTFQLARSSATKSPRSFAPKLTLGPAHTQFHPIDSDIDESRDYLVEDLIEAEQIAASGYIGGGSHEASTPRHNLTGDPDFTDGKRAAILLSTSRTAPQFVAWV